MFETKIQLCKYNNFNSVYNGNVIDPKSTIAYMGEKLDQSFSGDVIASRVLSKTLNKLKSLDRNARKINIKTRQLLVSNLIQCSFDYTGSAW